MPISSITGLPGNCKTLLMMHKLSEAAEANEKARKFNDANPDQQPIPVRPLVVYGVEGLIPGPWEVREDASNWFDECPDGALVFVDEAWKWFGHLHSAGRTNTPPHVLKLAEHRHRGIDFVWTYQATAQIYPFARGLCAEHTHCVRRWGLEVSDLYTWQELQEDVKSQAVRDRAQHSMWMFPKKLFGMYKSATLHTIKRKIPLKLLAIPACVVIAAVLLWYVYGYLKPDNFAARQTGKPVPTASAPDVENPTQLTNRNAQEKPPSLRETDPAAYMRPRIDGKLWTAPAYDQVAMAPPPRLACISTVDTCNCYTAEQGTRWHEVGQGTCRAIARFGYFDPTRQPAPAPVNATPGQPAATPAPVAAAPVTIPPTEPVERSTYAHTSIREAFRQPQAIPAPTLTGIQR